MAERKTKAALKQNQSYGKLIASENELSDKIISFSKTGINSGSLVPEFAIRLKEAKKCIDTLKKFVDEMMIPGVDYGIVPEVNKPTLLKPCAEKLCDVYGFSISIEITNRLEDWYRGMFHYEVKITLYCKRSGIIEAEGIGCCNSRETAYKDQSGNDVINSILKMAKKRAFIDAVLSATRSSNIFTQDIEEMEWLHNKSSKGITSKSVSVTQNNCHIFSDC